MPRHSNTSRIEEEVSETRHEKANNVSATTELSLEIAASTEDYNTSIAHHSKDGLTNHATNGAHRNGTSRDSSGGTPHVRTPSLISEFKSRIKDSVTGVHDILGASAANTSHELRPRRGSVVCAAYRDQIKSIDEKNKTGTDLSMYDRHCTRTCRKLHREISKNHFDDENKTGFLSRSRLLKIMTVERIEKDLRKNESFLERRSESLGHLRFCSPERNDGQKIDFRSEALKIIGKHSEEHIASSKKSYVIILAILIVIDRPARIKPFIDAQVCDDDLPLARCTSPEYTLYRRSAPHDALHCFHKWSQRTMNKFEEWQWAFLAPSFALAKKMSVPHHDVCNNGVLPFKPSKVVREGGFGRVRKVGIHRDHRAFGNGKVWNFFAIKTLVRNSSRKDFEREVAVLRRFSGNTHQHLISILGTYKKDEVFHMIFPWAELDLSALWKLDKIGPAPSAPTLRWMAQQCQGLADGLKSIHSHETFSGKSLLHPDSIPLHDTTAGTDAPAQQDIQPSEIHLLGRHGDLKPENILWFPDPNHHARNFKGTLKIADFGFVEFSRETMVDKRRRGFEVRSPTYLPPEVELENNISSSYDIWSLGCIYLEFVAWWLGGHDYMNEFGQSRLQVGSTLPGWIAIPSFKDDLFFQVTQENGTESLKAEVKDSVTKFIKRASDHRNSSSFIKAFLQIIEKKMIVVLDPGGGGRSSAGGVGKAIENMRQKHLQYSGAEEE